MRPVNLSACLQGNPVMLVDGPGWVVEAPNAVMPHGGGTAEVEKFSETTSGVILAVGEVIRRDPAEQDKCAEVALPCLVPLGLSLVSLSNCTTPSALSWHTFSRLGRPAAASSFLFRGRTGRGGLLEGLSRQSGSLCFVPEAV